MTRRKSRVLHGNDWMRSTVSACALAAFGGLSSPALGQSAPPEQQLREIIVTAQKRSESLQNVPISVTALGAEALARQNVTSFQDTFALLPSVSAAQLGPGRSQVYIRGISDGGDGNLSGTSPSVAIYLDEQPITSIGRVLNVHSYDIARVEALAGPQGTLYGASSESGTLKIVTNPPVRGKTQFGFDTSASLTAHSSDPSYRAEGFINLPFGDKVALRVVGWYSYDGGYIDNVAATKTYFGTVTVNNAPYVKKDFNTDNVEGARAALGIDLGHDWSATARAMHQEQRTHGVWDHDPEAVGDLLVERFFPDRGSDKFTQASLTINGKVGGVNVTYAGSYLTRKVEEDIDYSAYSEYSSYIPYYVCAYSGSTFNYASCRDPRIALQRRSKYKTWTHEFRLATDATARLHAIGGVFYQDQRHAYDNEFVIPAMDPAFGADSNPTGLLRGHLPTAYFVTDQVRRDREAALFGEVTYNISSKLAVTGGIRYYDTQSELKGVVGSVFSSTPAKDFSVTEKGFLYKANLSWKPRPGVLLYATYSQGFRPGGNNREAKPLVPPSYKSDRVYNYELGWKTKFANGRVRLNGAAFVMDWANIQFTRFDPTVSLLGFTVNAGTAQVKGVEADMSWLVRDGLTLSSAFSLIDARLKKDYIRNPTSGVINAPAGTRLPFVAPFSANVTGRYEAPVGDATGFAQVSMVYRGNSYNDLFVIRRQKQAPYTIVNMSIGVDRKSYGVALFADNVTDKRAELYRNNTDYDARITTNRPRTIGIRGRVRF